MRESFTIPHKQRAILAQSVEQLPRKEQVKGSIPLDGSTTQTLIPLRSFVILLIRVPWGIGTATLVFLLSAEVRPLTTR